MQIILKKISVMFIIFTVITALMTGELMVKTFKIYVCFNKCPDSIQLIIWTEKELEYDHSHVMSADNDGQCDCQHTVLQQDIVCVEM